MLPQFEGMRFQDLDARYQRRIEDTPLTVFSVQPESDEQVKFYLFERLNQGGVALNAQEIRNGIIRGPGLALVQRLAAEKGAFRTVAGAQRSYPRMKADELVLRGLAFLHHRPLDAYPGDMEPFLNDALRDLNRQGSDRLSAIEAGYVDLLGSVEAVFGADAFRRFVPEGKAFGRHLNAAVMDVQLWGFHRVQRPREHWVAKCDAVRGCFLALHDDLRFAEAITYATSVTARVHYRLRTWEEVLRDVAGNHA